MASSLGFDYAGPYLNIPSAGKRINHTRPLNKLLPRVVELDLEWTHQTPTIFSVSTGTSYATVLYNPFSIYDPDFNRGISEYSVQGFKELATAGYTHYFVRWCDFYFGITGSSTSGSNQACYMIAQPKHVNDGKFGQTTLLQNVRWAESPGQVRIKKISKNTQDMTGSMTLRLTPNYYWPAWSPSTDVDNWGTISWSSTTGASGTSPTNPHRLEVGIVCDQVPGATMGFNGHVSMRMHTVVWRQDATWPTFLDAKVIPYSVWSAAAGYEEPVEVSGGPPGTFEEQNQTEGSGVIADLEPALAWTDDA